MSKIKFVLGIFSLLFVLIALGYILFKGSVTGLVTKLVIVLLIIILIGFFISIYNSFVRLKINIEKAWANIDVLLKQRYDELTQIMNSVKGYMKYEKSVMLEITKARTAFMNAESVSDKAKSDNLMTSTFKSIFAVAENYPKIKASENVLQFQTRISEIENQISDRREFYNDSVTTYNMRLEQFPYVFIGKLFGYLPKEMFKVNATDKQKPKLKL